MIGEVDAAHTVTVMCESDYIHNNFSQDKGSGQSVVKKSGKGDVLQKASISRTTKIDSASTRSPLKSSRGLISEFEKTSKE